MQIVTLLKAMGVSEHICESPHTPIGLFGSNLVILTLTLSDLNVFICTRTRVLVQTRACTVSCIMHYQASTHAHTSLHEHVHIHLRIYACLASDRIIMPPRTRPLDVCQSFSDAVLLSICRCLLSSVDLLLIVSFARTHT